jgi:hypothetical protein
MAMAVDDSDLERKADMIITNMSGAYDDVLLSPLSFSTMIKHLTENVS